MSETRVRENILTMPEEKRELFLDSILKIKKSGFYDSLVKLHLDGMDNLTPWNGDSSDKDRERNSAHKGPGFLPWHRHFLKLIEEALVNASGDETLGLPYWNWFADSSIKKPGTDIKDPTLSKLWTEEFLGGNGVKDTSSGPGWVVQNGRFKQWPLRHNDALKPNKLQRKFSSIGLPTDKAKKELFNKTVYDASPWSMERDNDSFRNLLEGWNHATDDSSFHNQVHRFIGGSMSKGASPNDPAFYLNHSFVDKLWWDWQVNNTTSPDSDYSDTYEPVTGGPKGHNLNDAMFPWEADGITPAKVLDIGKLNYKYKD